MKKLLTVISLVCLGAFGFSSAVANGPSLTCNTTDTYCSGGDLYTVELNCFARSGDAAPAFTGTLATSHPSWTLAISYDDDTGNPPSASLVCDAAGTIKLDAEGSKTEVKCTEEKKGPRKKSGHKHFDGDTVQVDFEIKLEEIGSSVCV